MELESVIFSLWRSKYTTHLISFPWSGRWVNQRQLDHGLPDARLWTSGCQFKLDRLIQAGSVSPGVDGPICPQAEVGVAALENHSFIPHAVVKLDCGPREEREKRDIKIIKQLLSMIMERRRQRVHT